MKIDETVDRDAVASVLAQEDASKRPLAVEGLADRMGAGWGERVYGTLRGAVGDPPERDGVDRTIRGRHPDHGSCPCGAVASQDAVECAECESFLCSACSSWCSWLDGVDGDERCDGCSANRTSD